MISLPYIYILYLLSLLSFIIGILSGLVGIGAGLLTTIMLLAIGYPYPEVVATTLFLHVLPQTIPGFLFYYKEGHFKWKESFLIFIFITLGITMGAYIGSKQLIDKKYLHYILSSILILSALYILYKA